MGRLGTWGVLGAALTTLGGCASLGDGERPFRDCTFGLVAGAFGGGAAGSQVLGEDSEEMLLGAAAGAVALGAVGCAVERAIKKDRGEDGDASLDAGEDRVLRVARDDDATPPAEGAAVEADAGATATEEPKRVRIGPAIGRIRPEETTPPAPAPTRLAAREVYDSTKPLELDGVAPIQFAFDSAELSPEALATVRRLKELLGAAADAVLVIGHTCSIGSEEYNMDLSVRRAEAVRDRLIESGVPAERLIIEGEGEGAPLAGLSEANPKNRRVDFRMRK